MKLKDTLTRENVGGYDLLLRALLGSIAIVILAMDLVEPGLWKWITALVAFTGLFTGMTRHCTPYVLMGFSTAEKKN
ncbi:Protein of unknown function (DUF2892) [Methanomethylovorans hollandica DSM 15978]|jgi:hypothetical protein|uniref:Inner membrane protein YgaP-like transmembrane domain-containing protein n=1 Tax=Methanomethylovorans hollandica (strain DSM 15978 / NBRC 107637 / DMS1) TaxID=867904 RepID=L0KWN4_METHD|nr:DUF2892 domain-containing protein [Methanomethylovorans hollandica]AGB49842.1 Protein of unknown function (DUF2892) [Methanomethylovorans hollandica DSM 15978]